MTENINRLLGLPSLNDLDFGDNEPINDGSRITDRYHIIGSKLHDKSTGDDVSCYCRVIIADGFVVMLRGRASCTPHLCTYALYFNALLLSLHLSTSFSTIPLLHFPLCFFTATLLLSPRFLHVNLIAGNRR